MRNLPVKKITNVLSEEASVFDFAILEREPLAGGKELVAYVIPYMSGPSGSGLHARIYPPP